MCNRIYSVAHNGRQYAMPAVVQCFKKAQMLLVINKMLINSTKRQVAAILYVISILINILSMQSYLIEKYRQFLILCENNKISCDLKKFFYFCNKATYYNLGDNLFYEYAPLELHHRCSYSINHLFNRFTDWNNGRKFFNVYHKTDSLYFDTIKAKTLSKAKYKYAKDNCFDFIDIRGQVCYSYCL